jgi:hypothetical protein
MSKTLKVSEIVAVVLGAILGATFTVLLLPAPYAQSSVAVWVVAAGAFAASQRASANGPSGLHLAEVSASKLAEFQRYALASGLTSILHGPVDDVLDPNGGHYIVLRKIKGSRDSGRSRVARCTALFRLHSGELRCASLDVAADAFFALPEIEDQRRAEQIIKSYSHAPAYGA